MKITRAKPPAGGLFRGGVVLWGCGYNLDFQGAGKKDSLYDLD